MIKIIIYLHAFNYFYYWTTILKYIHLKLVKFTRSGHTVETTRNSLQVQINFGQSDLDKKSHLGQYLHA